MLAKRNSPSPSVRDHLPPSGIAILSEFLVDAGIAATVFLAPLFMGGRHSLGYLIYACLGLGTLACWSLRQLMAGRTNWFWSGAEWVILFALGLLVLQLLPLSPALLNSISPAIARYLPLWTSDAASDASLGQWSTISLVPARTRGGLVMLLGYAALFLVVVQRVQEGRVAERLMKWIAVAACGMAFLGLVQFFFSNGQYLWIYQNPERTTFGAVKGSFFNENHMAHFLAMGVAPLLWWLATLPGRKEADGSFGSARSSRRVNNDAMRLVLSGGLIIVCVSALFTFSRGGLIAGFVAGAISITVFAWRGLLGRRSLYGLGAAAAVVCCAVAIYGHETLKWQWQTLTSGSLAKMDAHEGRRRIYAADAKVVADYPWVGAGVGSHVEVYKQYFPEYSAIEYEYAESSYLHVLVETGICGASLLLVGLGLAIRRCLRVMRTATESESSAESHWALGTAALASLAGSAVHALVDFSWFIPACLTMLGVQVACAYRPLARSSEGIASRRLTSFQLELRPWGWGVATLASLLLGLFAFQNRLGPYLASADWERVSSDIKGVIRSGVALVDAGDEDQAAMLERLANVTARDPENSRAHLELAMVAVSAFNRKQKFSENPMELIHIRDAALKSKFPSRAAQDQWLNAVMGPNRTYLDNAFAHARKAVELCPLHGEGYAFLAQLAFLVGADARDNAALIDQALTVRPHSGEVLVVAGAEAAFNGDGDKQLAFWKRAFANDPRVQKQLVDLLAPLVGAREFLSDMPIDLRGARLLLETYQRYQRREDAALVAQRLLELNRREIEHAPPEAAAELWNEAQLVHAYFGQHEEAVACARQAVQASPEQFRWHKELALRLAAVGNFPEAIDELRWCLSRYPDDEELQAQLVQYTRQNLSKRPENTPAQPDRAYRRR